MGNMSLKKRGDNDNFISYSSLSLHLQLVGAQGSGERNRVEQWCTAVFRICEHPAIYKNHAKSQK